MHPHLLFGGKCNFQVKYNYYWLKYNFTKWISRFFGGFSIEKIKHRKYQQIALRKEVRSTFYILLSFKIVLLNFSFFPWSFDVFVWPSLSWSEDMGINTPKLNSELGAEPALHVLVPWCGFWKGGRLHPAAVACARFDHAGTWLGVRPIHPTPAA